MQSALACKEVGNE